MENCLEEVPHGSQDCYPYYNLFQSSVFYDTDNFRVAYLSLRYDDSLSAESGTRCSDSKERSVEPPDKFPGAGKSAAGSDVNEKRIIAKEELYQDPDLFWSKYEDVQSPTAVEPAYLANSQPWGYDWTKQSWVKSGGKLVVMSKKEERKKDWRNKQKLYKQLANAPRIKISKAESMMHKMGWQGGALGKTSEGILEPITPDPLYGSSYLGFGQRTNNTAAATAKKQSKHDVFRTNVLLYVLEFVQDDTEIELHFDAALRQHERRVVHSLVRDALGGAGVATLNSVAQYDLVADIHRCSQYELGTVSQGVSPDRQITIYKEAPEHVYLVTPDDFQEKIDETGDEQLGKQTTTSEHQNEENESTAKNELSKVNDAVKSMNDESEPLADSKSMEMDDDENPFLKSIKKSIKNDEEPKSITNKFEKDCNIAKENDDAELLPNSPEGKMLEFFLEFVNSEAFKELRFLGKFTAQQTAVINDFLNEVAVCIDDVDRFKGNAEMLKAFRNGQAKYELREGYNGTTEIHKIQVGGHSDRAYASEN